MRKINVSDCEVGMILGKPIFYNGAAILLEAGIELSESYINRLNSMGISEIYIEDDISIDITIPDVVNNETRREAIGFISEAICSYKRVGLINSKKALEIVENILKDIFSLDDIIINLIDIKTCDNYTFQHSVNVCILSVLIGMNLKLSYEELKELGIGSLLHDIGKVMIPSNILLKRSALNDKEYEIIKQHTLLGYDILKKADGISEASIRVALDHHERYDGNGYISGLKKDEIHIYSRIVAVADIFDALTSDRIYRKRISISQALEYITDIAKSFFDPQIIKCFLKIIPPFPIGTGVCLNTGEKGLVIKINKHNPTKPIIRIVFDKHGHKKSAYTEIDLEKREDYLIMSASELV